MCGEGGGGGGAGAGGAGAAGGEFAEEGVEVWHPGSRNRK